MEEIRLFNNEEVKKMHTEINAKELRLQLGRKYLTGRGTVVELEFISGTGFLDDNDIYYNQNGEAVHYNANNNITTNDFNIVHDVTNIMDIVKTKINTPTNVALSTFINDLDSLPKEVNLVKKKYCDLGTSDSCLIPLKINGTKHIVLIKKYQDHYGSIEWDSIFGKIDDPTLRTQITEALFDTYEILINEKEFIDQYNKFKEIDKGSTYFYNEYYTLEVYAVESKLDWYDVGVLFGTIKKKP